ncbi:protein KRI1 [Trichuris trichiura]|uniref:Protein KRI1 homolog n=1 Tax=Trichuris trichiura TaxID=36087 RepID=A0A077YZ66_TRITR|nr:protein KRI1 [Trichuris trichiura]
MDKPQLFDSDEEVSDKLAVNNAYAAGYNTWRRKEELRKLKDKYGDSYITSDSASSSDTEDERAEEVSPEMEKSFFKALSALKARDPKIYDPNVVFFNKSEQQPKEDTSGKSKTKQPVMHLRDLERQRLLSGKFSESDEDTEQGNEKNMTYVQKQKEIVDSFQNIPFDDDDEEGLFKVKEKTEVMKKCEEADFIEWLKGESENCGSEEKADLQYLRDFWDSQAADSAESYLRDYLLNRRYRDEEDGTGNAEGLEDQYPDYECDEEALENQEEFEEKYRFRFQEPSADVIMTYPREPESSVRRKDDRRKRARETLKERKKIEQIRRQEELKLLKNLKKKEIQEKLEKLRKAAGAECPIDEQELEKDFDPDEHDRQMHEMFNDEYYSHKTDEKKPFFSDSGEEDNADAEPSSSQNTYKEIKRKVENLRASNNGDDILEKCMEEYYKLDYEDMIDGNIPCRFKYRKVVPNQFGLDVTEILKANDKELNAWVSIKKMSQYIPETHEHRLRKVYTSRGRNDALKRKILRSIYGEEEEAQSSKLARHAEKQQGRKADVQLAEKTPKELKRTIALVSDLTDARMQAYGVNPKKLRNKIKYGHFSTSQKPAKQ